MYLSKLRIFGFKSFANKVEVNFPGEGITSVVGPNGCGKSNIIDAIRWVLGEQKVKALRSNKMEDVIFSGTAERQATGMAEVSLLINNNAGLLPSEYSQIMLTRRAYRTGESEYLINNQPCRLKDIHNLFYDTGMGAASYSLIEAKMIDSILSDKAEERRVMFEEASGISKYKQQRKETLRQLEKTALDLARVEDNMRHLQQNVNMFEKQARKAEKWRELKKACVSLELSYQYDFYLETQEKFRGFKKSLEESGHRVNEVQAKTAVQEALLEERKTLMFSEEQTLNRLNQLVAGTNAEAIRLENEGDKAKDRVQHLSDSILRLNRESDTVHQRLADFLAQNTQALEEIARLEVDLSQLAGLSTGGEEQRQKLQEEYLEKRRLADELSEERVSVLEEVSAIRNRAGSSTTESNHLEILKEEMEASLELTQERESLHSAEKENVESQTRALDTQNADLTAGIRTDEERLEALVRNLDALKVSRREIENEKVALETHLRVLRNLQNTMEGVDGGVRHLLEHQKEKVKAILADSIKVADVFIPAVERGLGKLLQTVMVEAERDGRELMDEIRREKKGEAAVFPVSSTQSFKRERPSLEGPGFKGWLIDQVEIPEGLDSLVEQALGHYAAMESTEHALTLLPRIAGRDIWLVCDNGDMFHASGLMTGGYLGEGENGLLQRKAILQQTEIRLSEIDSQYSAHVEALSKGEGELKRLQESLDGMRKTQKEVETLWQEGRGKLAVLYSSLDNSQREREQAEGKLRQVRERLLELDNANRELSEQLEMAEETRRTLESRFQRASQEALQAEAEKTRFEERIRNLEREKNQGEAQIRAMKNKLEYLERSRGEQESLLLRNGVQKEEWEDSIKQNLSKIEELAEQIQSVHERLSREEKERDEAKSIYDGKVSFLDEIRKAIRNLHDDMRTATKESHDLELKMEQARTILTNIRERMFELHDVDFDREDLEFERAEYDLGSVEEQVRDLKEKLKNLGNINTGALEDYEAEKLRLDEVQKQFEDLETARLGLERAIKKLDKVAKEQFLKTFAVVQKNFQEVFSSLFEGGEAQLALEESVDPLDARIDINARPTGKKMRGVSLLSGGERALTAISLLFALYLVKPSPYCIMDEVDGPLDDANIGRFVNLLRRFAHQTQFIVVTHNKRTMAASDMLYGVTQEVKGISKLVSVQLDEASRIAA